MIRTALLLASLVLLAPAAPAQAHTHGDLEADVQAAHDYWHSDVCNRQWVITPDATLSARGHGGEATGIGFTYNPTSGSYVGANGRWDWYIDRCEFTVDPALQGCARRDVVRHEIGHFIYGPSHDGPMAPEVLAAASYCKPPVPDARPVVHVASRHVKRTRAQIARSLRFRRTMAKIWARAAKHP